MAMLPQDMDALVCRIVGGSGQDSEIDEIIHCDVLGHERSTPFCEHCRRSTVVFYPAYTRDLDDALRAIPDCWSKDVWLKRHGGHHWSCELHRPSHSLAGRHTEPARAILIAALNAQLDSPVASESTP